MTRLRALPFVVALVGCPSDAEIGNDHGPDDPCEVDCERGRTFRQVSRVDLVLVIDNSPSMAEEHGRLAASIPELLAHAVGDDHDLHLGVLATDLEDPAHGGRLVQVDGAAYTDATDVDVASAWVADAIAAIGTGGANAEKPRAVIHEAFTTHADTANAGFRRDDAHLAFVILSEEDDASGARPSFDAFGDWLGASWGLESVTAHAIVGRDGECGGPCVCQVGSDHLDLVALTTGTTLSICEPDYGQFLAALGQLVILEGLDTRFYLSEVPVKRSIVVTVRYPLGFVDVLETGDFTWNGDELAIILDAPPPPGATIEVRYQARYASPER